MKIGFVLNSFPEISESFILNQIVGLILQGHDVHVYSLSQPEPASLHEDVSKYNLLERTTYKTEITTPWYKRLVWILYKLTADVSILNWRLLLSTLNVFRFGRRAINLTLLQEAWWFISHADFDVVHAHYGTTGRYLARMKENGFLGQAAMVVTFHGFDLDPSKLTSYRHNYIGLFKHSDTITVNTPYLRDMLMQVEGATDPYVLPVGLDTEKFNKTKRSPGRREKLKILFCGRLIALKGPQVAIDIVHELVANRGVMNIQLTVVGEGIMRTALERQIKQLGIADHVHLLGSKTQEEIVKIMEETGVFLLPGIHDPDTGRVEAQGLVIQEAQAMELPVIVSDVGGMKFGLIDGTTGFVVKEGDIQGFADRIEELMADEALRAEMGRAGRAFVVENYDTKVLTKRLVEIYEEAKE